MRIRDAMATGWRLVLRERRVVVFVWLTGLLFALPPALLVAGSVATSLRGSRTAEQNLQAGFDMTWFDLYQESADGLEATFSPTLAGGGAFLDNLEAWVSGTLFTRFPVTLALGAAWGVIWLLLVGGVVHRFVHGRDGPALSGVLRHGGGYFFRFLRLALLFGLAYGVIYLIHQAMFARLDEWTRDTTSEWPVFLLSVAAYALTALQLVFVHVCSGYAKVATVMDDRRSMILAAARGLGFVLLHARRTLGLAAALALAVALLVAVYTWLAPGAGQSTPVAVAGAFLVGQAVLLARLVARLTHIGGQVALYRHAAGEPL